MLVYVAKNLTYAIFQPRIKLLCAILSLPVPSEAAHSGIQEDNKNTSKLAVGNLEQKKPCKFLMVGSEKSGTSTLFKQVWYLLCLICDRLSFM